MFPRRIAGAGAFVAAFLLFALFHPAVAVAISDPHGTRLYGSQAIVATKRILPLDVDVSFGFGNGRLGKEPLPEQGEGFEIELLTDPRKWARGALPFGGIQYAPAPWISLLRSIPRSATNGIPGIQRRRNIFRRPSALR